MTMKLARAKEGLLELLVLQAQGKTLALLEP